MSKFKLTDHVRVTAPTAYWFDRTGVVADIQLGKPYSVYVDLDDGGQVSFRESELILADVVEANNRAFVDGMEAVGAAAQKMAADYMDARDAHADAVTFSDSDKLRMIADTVDGQLPFGTELANFRKRLLAVLSIGERP